MLEQRSLGAATDERRSQHLSLPLSLSWKGSGSRNYFPLWISQLLKELSAIDRAYGVFPMAKYLRFRHQLMLVLALKADTFKPQVNGHSPRAL